MKPQNNYSSIIISPIGRDNEGNQILEFLMDYKRLEIDGTIKTFPFHYELTAVETDSLNILHDNAQIKKEENQTLSDLISSNVISKLQNLQRND